jgi:DNA-directed RNA polymerase subunit RPC12/RpoP
MTETELCWCPLGEWCDSDHDEPTCNCICGCENPLGAGTCVDCSENGDHQNNNELVIINGKVLRKADTYGCGSWNCYDCYPYQYSCDDCSEMFTTPIDNGTQYDCEHCGYESFPREGEEHLTK